MRRCPSPLLAKQVLAKKKQWGAQGSQRPWVQMVQVTSVQLPGTDSPETLHSGNRHVCACLLTPLHLNMHAYVYMCSDSCAHVCVQVLEEMLSEPIAFFSVDSPGEGKVGLEGHLRNKEKPLNPLKEQRWRFSKSQPQRTPSASSLTRETHRPLGLPLLGLSTQDLCSGHSSPWADCPSPLPSAGTDAGEPWQDIGWSGASGSGQQGRSP